MDSSVYIWAVKYWQEIIKVFGQKLFLNCICYIVVNLYYIHDTWLIVAYHSCQEHNNEYHGKLAI